MKYTIFGFSQQLMVEQCVNLSDAAVLRFIIDFYHTGKMKKMIVGGREYIWVDYKYVSDNLPIIHVGYKSKTDRANKKRVTDCIQSLVSAGVLEKYIQKDTQGTFVYIRIIEEMYNRYIVGATTTKVTGYHHKGNGATTTEVVLYNDDSSINDSSINDSISDDFKKFWDLYAKKVDPKKCSAKWNKLKAADKEQIFKTLPAYINSTPDKQYRKNPLTYLNGESWNSEIISSNNQQSGGMKKNGFNQEYYGPSSAGKENEMF